MFLFCFIVGNIVQRLNGGYILEIFAQVLVGVISYFSMLIILKDDYVNNFLRNLRNKLIV